ncbi:MAG: sugar phosphate isomerase/epimerase [Tannerella sp.]|jgi:sugar phosphate isomerase/epimerase|nr:sugar phosphate isomerase/epimerase [Tannerella sp.]
MQQKNLNRREFLKLSATSSLGLFALNPLLQSCQSTGSKSAAESIDLKSFGAGLQLYSIRDAMTADARGSLKKVSDMGYKYMELADYSNRRFYGYSPSEFKKILADLGMEALSSHTAVEADGITSENAKAMADDHAALGVKYCVQPWINDEDRTHEKYKTMIADWNEVGRIMKSVGIQFAYHNHNFEFLPTDGIVPYYDIFLKEMDADLITMEIDLYWVTKAGHDPVEIFNKYPGRFKLWHFKDQMHPAAPIYEVEKEDITSVGVGSIDFKRIYAARAISGMQHHFVEDDNQGQGLPDSQGNAQPFVGIETSIKNLTSGILV